jgi:Mg2+-importing ATPase
MTSALVDAPDGTRLIVVKGAPESVIGRCVDVPGTAQATLQSQFAAGSRVVAVASRPAPNATALGAADEHDLHRPVAPASATCPQPRPSAATADEPFQLSRTPPPPRHPRLA